MKCPRCKGQKFVLAAKEGSPLPDKITVNLSTLPRSLSPGMKLSVEVDGVLDIVTIERCKECV